MYEVHSVGNIGNFERLQFVNIVRTVKIDHLIMILDKSSSKHLFNKQTNLPCGPYIIDSVELTNVK